MEPVSICGVVRECPRGSVPGPAPHPRGYCRNLETEGLGMEVWKFKVSEGLAPRCIGTPGHDRLSVSSPGKSWGVCSNSPLKMMEHPAFHPGDFHPQPWHRDEGDASCLEVVDIHQVWTILHCQPRLGHRREPRPLQRPSNHVTSLFVTNPLIRIRRFKNLDNLLTMYVCLIHLDHGTRQAN